MTKNIVAHDLKALATELAHEYQAADPFPHVVIDNFFDEAFLDRVVAEFPDLARIPGVINGDNGITDIKLMTKRGDRQCSPLGKQLVWYLNSHEFIDFLQKLTGIKSPLVPDPHLIGGGMHEIKPGGFLKVHTDYMFHHETKLDRRLNVLVYLNKNWKEEYGGDLQLWDSELTACHKRVYPVFNRCVVFGTTSFTYHGLPDPLLCPEGMSRRSFALYYYSNGRPAQEIKPVESQTTVFVNRPGEKMKPKKDWHYWMHQVLPPIAIEAGRAIRDAVKPTAR